MPLTDSLSGMEDAIRDAIAGETFAEAARLLETYASAVDARVMAAGPDSAESKAGCQRAMGLFAWATERVGVFISCAEHESARIRSIAAYGRGTNPPALGVSA